MDRPATRNPWPAMAAVLLTLTVFAPVCGHEFITWDDPTYVAGNPGLLNPTPDSLVSIWKQPEPGLYIPLPYTIWWLVAQVARVRDAGHWTLNPAVFHAANVLFQGVFVAVVYALLRRLRMTPWPAAIGALAAGVHPLAVESVAWVMGLRDQLAAIFAIAAIVCVLADRGRWARPAAAVLTALACLSKPTAVMTWPLAVVMVRLSGDVSWKQALRRTWPLAVVAAGGLLLTRLGNQSIHPDISRPWQRPLIAADAMAFYVRKLLLPWPLAFDYARFPESIFASKAAWWTWTIPAGAAVILWRLRSRVAWAVAALVAVPVLPTLGLIPFAFQSLSTVADHYAYPSLAGIGLAVALACRRGRMLRALVALALLCWIGLSIRQSAAWANDATFFPYMTSANPTSGPAWVGVARVRLAANDLPGARAAIDRAIEVNPDYGEARLTAILILSAQNDPLGVDQQLDTLERIFRGQANFDPELMRRMRARFHR